MVGVNTSAKIEGDIIGRPVYSVIAEDFAVTQEGTLYFQHLKREVGGLLLLRVALLPATVITMERTKLRAMVLHWTRLARLLARALTPRLIYAARFLRRLPRLMRRLAKTTVSRVLIKPVRWGLKQGKTGLHAFLGVRASRALP